MTPLIIVGSIFALAALGAWSRFRSERARERGAHPCARGAGARSHAGSTYGRYYPDTHGGMYAGGMAGYAGGASAGGAGDCGGAGGGGGDGGSC